MTTTLAPRPAAPRAFPSNPVPPRTGPKLAPTPGEELGRARATLPHLARPGTSLDPARVMTPLPAPPGMTEVWAPSPTGFAPTLACIFCRAVKDDRYAICAKCYSVGKRCAEAAVLARYPDIPEEELERVKPFTREAFARAMAGTPRKRGDRRFRVEPAGRRERLRDALERRAAERRRGILPFVPDPSLSLDGAAAFFTQWRPEDGELRSEDGDYPVEWYAEDFLIAPAHGPRWHDSAHGCVVPGENTAIDTDEHDEAADEDRARRAFAAERAAAGPHVPLRIAPFPHGSTRLPRPFTDARIAQWDKEIDQWLRGGRAGPMLWDAGIDEAHSGWAAAHRGTELPRIDAEVHYVRIRWAHFVVAEIEATFQPFGALHTLPASRIVRRAADGTRSRVADTDVTVWTDPSDRAPERADRERAGPVRKRRLRRAWAAWARAAHRLHLLGESSATSSVPERRPGIGRHDIRADAEQRRDAALPVAGAPGRRVGFRVIPGPRRRTGRGVDAR